MVDYLLTPFQSYIRTFVDGPRNFDATRTTPKLAQPTLQNSSPCQREDFEPLELLTLRLNQYCLQNNGENGFEKTHFSPAFPQLEEQYGFREGHSTTDQLLYFCQRIRDAHNRKPTNHTVAVFLDLSKAFDRVCNNFLLIKLYKMFGIGGKALLWIYDFLRNSLIRVKFNNSFSRSFSFFEGVPQGSVLSPTLFSLYLSGIESVIKRKCEVDAFADDICKEPLPAPGNRSNERRYREEDLATTGEKKVGTGEKRGWRRKKAGVVKSRHG
ncbi:reverse transcriptase domain-containing protein [Trichonephila clavipes]|nr:reverse transcriptase domain-containing protein [Trichonephila clavipes]